MTDNVPAVPGTPSHGEFHGNLGVAGLSSEVAIPIAGMATSKVARLRPDCRGVAVGRRPRRRRRWKGGPR
eukprot:11224975-Lingulodinium_polyedra.AAC.1